MIRTQKRKHKLKKPEPLAKIEGNFNLVGCDLSMRCPGFVLMRYNAAKRSVILLRKSAVKNRNAKISKPHGKILTEISSEFGGYLSEKNVRVVVRERALSRFHNEVMVLNKVTGVTEMQLWTCMHMSFQELTPTEIKKSVTGYYRASKEEVAEAIDNYCAHSNFETDDESDACACTIAWLILNGYLDAKPLEKYKSRKEDEEISEENGEVEELHVDYE